MSKNMRTFMVTFTATVEVDAERPSMAEGLVEDSLDQGGWREINALDISDVRVKEGEEVEEEELVYRVWCEQCKRAPVFKTPEGMKAPFTPADWSDEAGHNLAGGTNPQVPAEGGQSYSVTWIEEQQSAG